MADFDNFVNSTTSSDLLEVEKLSERVVIVSHPGEDSLPREGVAYEIQNVVPPEQRRVATFYREKPGKRAEHSPSFAELRAEYSVFYAFSQNYQLCSRD